MHKMTMTAVADVEMENGADKNSHNLEADKKKLAECGWRLMGKNGLVDEWMDGWREYVIKKNNKKGAGSRRA